MGAKAQARQSYLGPSRPIPVRLPLETIDALRQLSLQERMPISLLMRRAIYALRCGLACRRARVAASRVSGSRICSDLVGGFGVPFAAFVRCNVAAAQRIADRLT